MLVTIYHNPRCSKSRKALEILQNKDINLNIIPYLDQGLKEEEINEIAAKLGLEVEEFMRKKEQEYKNIVAENHEGFSHIKILVQLPKLLERPIVVVGNKAVIARPPEKLEELF